MKTVLDTPTVKSEIKNKYPYLAKHTHYPNFDKSNLIVVMFTKPQVGMVVHVHQDNKYRKLGEYRTDWIEAVFTPMDGILTMEND